MYDIPFVFYDGIAIDRELLTSTLMRRWCNGERRRNTDAPIDDRRTASVDKKSQVRKCWRVDERIGV
jgi:hypothetical protein